MSENIEILKKLPDQKPVRVFLPLMNHTKRYRTQAVYQKTSPPEFGLFFEGKALPSEEIDTAKTCIVTIDLGGAPTSMEARIKSIKSNHQLNMIVDTIMNYEQMRDFFRVDAVTEVIGAAIKPELCKEKGIPPVIQGKTIDISGNGILAVFSECPPHNENMYLNITLPGKSSEKIRVLGKPVRIIETKEGNFEAAYTFIDIESQDRDRLIGCCFELQRQLLRLKVRVK